MNNNINPPDIKLITDCKPTLGLFNNNKPNSRLFFWKVRISRNFV